MKMLSRHDKSNFHSKRPIKINKSKWKEKSVNHFRLRTPSNSGTLDENFVWHNRDRPNAQSQNVTHKMPSITLCWMPAVDSTLYSATSNGAANCVHVYVFSLQCPSESICNAMKNLWNGNLFEFKLEYCDWRTCHRLPNATHIGTNAYTNSVLIYFYVSIQCSALDNSRHKTLLMCVCRTSQCNRKKTTTKLAHWKYRFKYAAP